MRFRSMILVLFLLPILSVFAGQARAGGTPENLVLIVNANNASSLNIANHYIHWRKVPPKNVIYLTTVPAKHTININEFRDRILKPVIAEIQKRKLSAQVDYLVYSSGFPTRVTADSDVKQSVLKDQLINNKMLKWICSTTAMTYYLQSVMNKQVGYLSLDGNWYYRGLTKNVFRVMFLGDDQKKFAEATKKMNAGEYDEAAQQLLDLTKRHGDNFLLYYQVSRCYAKAGKVSESALALNTAAQKGFRFRNYLETDSAFDGVREEKAFQSVVNRIATDRFKYLPTQGFRSRYAWQPNGIREVKSNSGRKYFISTMLAHTDVRGNTDEEVLKYLKAAIDADGTQPKGTFYFTKTTDVRTRTRERYFGDAIEALAAAGHVGKVVESILPSNKQDVLGCSTGRNVLSWEKSKCKILPGAIVENLTSYGGVLIKGQKQTPLTEFLRYGAAGSSGTTCEPYAIQAKFPHPMIHAHYANGASLGEAFYQSVNGPFQLLIVGDPLCQPFAKPQKFAVKGLEPNQEVKGKVEFEITPTNSKDSIAQFELFTDGVLRANLAVGRKVSFDSKSLSDGYHEIRIVGVAADRVETRSRVIIPFVVNNSGSSVELKTNPKVLTLGNKFDFSLNAKGATRIRLFQNGRVLGTVRGENGRIQIETEILGQGPSTLFAVADISGKPVQSLPLQIEVKKPNR